MAGRRSRARGQSTGGGERGGRGGAGEGPDDEERVAGREVGAADEREGVEDAARGEDAELVRAHREEARDQAYQHREEEAEDKRAPEVRAGGLYHAEPAHVRPGTPAPEQDGPEERAANNARDESGGHVHARQHGEVSFGARPFGEQKQQDGCREEGFYDRETETVNGPNPQELSVQRGPPSLRLLYRTGRWDLQAFRRRGPARALPRARIETPRARRRSYR